MNLKTTDLDSVSTHLVLAFIPNVSSSDDHYCQMVNLSTGDIMWLSGIASNSEIKSLAVLCFLEICHKYYVEGK